MMAKFRDSNVIEAAVDAVSVPGPRQAASPPPGQSTTMDRSIGDIIAELRNLTIDQVEQVLAHQRDTGVRFGEAAVALGLATREDVLFALSQQFHYPYAPEENKASSPELVALNEPFSQRAEMFRALRSQLIARNGSESERARPVAVISANNGDGKTYCAANLAVALAQLGGRTLLVDADMRNARQHELFNLSNRSGLSGILSGRESANAIQQITVVPSLFVLPVGVIPPNPLELVERSAFGLLMRELAIKFDHVIVDTPAAAVGSDAAVIAHRCGAAMLVARKDHSRVAVLRDLVTSFAGSTTRVLGTVVNEF